MEVFSLMSQSGTQTITTNILPDICGTQLQQTYCKISRSVKIIRQ